MRVNSKKINMETLFQQFFMLANRLAYYANISIIFTLRVDKKAY